MIYIALLIACVLIIGLFVLLLAEIGKQYKPKPKPIKRTINGVRSTPKKSQTSFQSGGVGDRARLRAQAKRTGHKLSPSTQILSKPVTQLPSPPIPPPVVVEVEPEPEPLSLPPPVVVEIEPPELEISNSPTSPPPVEVETNLEPEAASEPESEPELELEPEPEPEPEPELELELEPEPEPEPEPELEPEPALKRAVPVVIPDFFTPPPKANLKRQRRNPTQFYPRLVSLLHGDRDAADRLVQNLLDAYPDKSERWCYEKAVFDLTRDRD